jgi:hypothetical protein
LLKKSLRRCAVPLRWEARGVPSAARPLDGVTVHRTVTGVRLALAFFNPKSKKCALVLLPGAFLRFPTAYAVEKWRYFAAALSLLRRKAQPAHPARAFAASRLTPIPHRRLLKNKFFNNLLRKV